MPEKKSKHDGMIRGFYHLSAAWYADANLKDRTDGLIDNVMIGFYGENGNEGTTGEFAVDWKMLGGDLTPQLKVFSDSWETLTHFSDLLAEMAKLDGTDPAPKEFCEVLIRLGLKDLTPRGNPYESKSKKETV